MTRSIRRVTPAETFPLRQRVLRPHETHDAIAVEHDEADAVHLAVIEDGTVIACAVVWRQAAPWDETGELSWRLRGMATAEDKRRQGAGRAALDAALEYVKANGGGLLWCEARTPAQSFYERADFVTRGDVWEEPMIGPHIMMELQVESSSS